MKQPKFSMGEEVEFTVTAHLKDKEREYSVKDRGYIVAIYMRSTESDIVYEYGITDDPPRPYYAGKPPFIRMMEHMLTSTPKF